MLNWQENLSGDEMPPQWMWHCDVELKVWFERVKDDRDAKYGNTGDVDTGDTSSMMQNEFAEGRR